MSASPTHCSLLVLYGKPDRSGGGGGSSPPLGHPMVSVTHPTMLHTYGQPVYLVHRNNMHLES